MATRNRTLLFRKYRDALKSVRAPTSSSASTSSSAGGPVIELSTTSLLNPNRSYAPLSTEDPGNSSRGALTVGLPPAWVDVSEEISANMQRARVKMADLNKAHAKALMPSFGDGKEDQRLIEALTQEITGLIKKSEKGLQRLSAAGPSEDSNVRKNVQRSLATDLQNLSMELRKKQSTYLKRLRQQKEGQDGVDIEMNLNGNRSRVEDDDLDDMVYLPTEEEFRSYLYPYEDVICSECHQGGHDDLMLLCDECDSSAHTFCVGLGHEVPEGSWFCRDCKPLDPESPNSPQTHLSDQRLANNTSTNRASVVINNAGEGFDLNSVSSQGLAALPSPRQQFGGFQATMPLAGAGASTVSGRIRLRHQIHHCLSERPDRPEGNFPSSQLEQVRETIQQESAQFLDERFCENHSPVGQGSDLRPSNNLSHHPIRGMGQNQNQNQNPNPTTILSGISNDALWPGLEERNSLLGFEQQLRQCNGGPNSCSVRQEFDFHAAKEQLQLMVKSHLKNLSRGSDLAQSKLEDIAKCSTQTILVACGLGHNDVVVLPMSPPPTCDYIEITPGKPSLVRGCCSSCFDSFVGDVVKKILDAKLSEVQQWLCLAL